MKPAAPVTSTAPSGSLPDLSTCMSSLPAGAEIRCGGDREGQLSRIESGHNRVRYLDKLIDYARRLRVPAELLWFDMGEETGAAPTPRGVVALPDGPVVSAAAARTELVLADALIETLDQYATTDNLAGARSLLQVVPQQIAFIDRLLDGSRGRTRARLLYVAARFAEFAGWLNQDAGDLHAAMRWSNSALDLAVEAGDPHLVSYVRMRKSNIASDAGNPTLALAFARAALQNPRELTPRLLAVALRQEANAHVLSGNADECARTLDLAFQHAEDAQDDAADVARYCTPSWVEMEAAHCWVALGKPAKAITTLQQSLADFVLTFVVTSVSV